MSTQMAPAPRRKASEEAGGTPGRKTQAIQVEKELARMVAVIASHQGITQADLVSPVLRPFILARYAELPKKIQDELKAKPQAD